MKKILDFLKNNLIGIVLGAIVFGSAGAAIAATIQSSNVSYTTNKNSSITNVKQAIDDLKEYNDISENLVSPYSVNISGNGYPVTSRYRNDNFSGKVGTEYNSLNELIDAYGIDNFNENPYYVKITSSGHMPCIFYNHKEFCVNLSNQIGSLNPNLVDLTSVETYLSNLIKEKLNVNPSCSTSNLVVKCTFGGHSCGYKISITGCYNGGCGGQAIPFCGKCWSRLCYSTYQG